MSRKTQRAGAFASTGMLFAALFAFLGSGAHAEISAPADPYPGHSPTEIAADDGQRDAQSSDAGIETPEVRFVSSPVVQALPEKAPEAAVMPEDAASLRELVGAMPATADLSENLKCLAQAIYFESRGEPLAGQLAVARVIINRAASPQFPDDYCSVIKQKAQFSFVRQGRIPAANTASDAWNRAQKIARIAHQNLWESAAGDALFFHAGHVNPRWAHRKTALATIDDHIFYR